MEKIPGWFYRICEGLWRVDYQRILDKLEVMSVRTMSLDLIQSYLMNMEQRNHISNNMSYEISTVCETPQGIVLGLILFTT